MSSYALFKRYVSLATLFVGGQEGFANVLIWKAQAEDDLTTTFQHPFPLWNVLLMLVRSPEAEVDITTEPAEDNRKWDTRLMMCQRVFYHLHRIMVRDNYKKSETDSWSGCFLADFKSKKDSFGPKFIFFSLLWRTLPCKNWCNSSLLPWLPLKNTPN